MGALMKVVSTDKVSHFPNTVIQQKVLHGTVLEAKSFRSSLRCLQQLSKCSECCSCSWPSGSTLCLTNVPFGNELNAEQGINVMFVKSLMLLHWVPNQVLLQTK